MIVPPPALDAIGTIERRPGDDLIFHTPRGYQLNKGSLAYLWRPVAAAWREQTGRSVTPHELRHACATLLLERGLTPADAAEQLGHSDGGRLVQTLYGHPEAARTRDRLKLAFAAEGPQPDVEGVTEGGTR